MYMKLDTLDLHMKTIKQNSWLEDSKELFINEINIESLV